MNEYSVLSVLFAPIVILLDALLVVGIAQILTSLRRDTRTRLRRLMRRVGGATHVPPSGLRREARAH